MIKRIAILLFLLLIILCKTKGQDRIISGRLLDDTGEALPGVNIFIKGTQTGTITDIDGNYSIVAPLGSVLVYSFIGFMAEEVTVNERNSRPLNNSTHKKIETPQKITRPKIKGLENQKGVAMLSDSSAKYTIRNKNWLNANEFPYYIHKIKYEKPSGSDLTGRFILVNNSPARNRFNLRYHTSFAVSEAINLPLLQNEYAQGASQLGQLVWQGPETNITTSWGPAIKYLEFDGSDYMYDKSGRLVELGTGNGTPAKNYNPYDILKRELYTAHELTFSSEYGDTQLNFDISHLVKSGILPGAGENTSRLGFNTSGYYGAISEAKTSVYYSRSKSSLPLVGSNYARIFQNILLTPPTFDNANGLSGKKAVGNEEAYLVPDNLQRSFAMGFDNPYYLLEGLPDENLTQLFSAGVLLNFNNLFYVSNLRSSFSTNYNHQNAKEQSGMPSLSTVFTGGYFSDRITEKHSVNTDFSVKYKKENINSSVDFGLNYIYHLNSINFDEDQTQGVNDQPVFKIEKYRHVHEIIPGILYSQKIDRWKEFLTIKVANNFYISSSDTQLFLPTLRTSFDLKNLLLYDSFIRKLSVYGMYTKSVNEAPLFNENRTSHFNWFPMAMIQSVPDLTTIFEDHSQPEKITRMETGVTAGVSVFEVNLTLFREITKDLILPVDGWQSLENVGDLKNTGYELSMDLHHIRMGAFDLSINGFVSQNKPVVTDIYNNRWYRISGFSDVGTSLIKGKPYGAITGSVYSRNEDGNLIIDNNGYPISDFGSWSANPPTIGNPNPDWTAGLSYDLSYKSLNLEMIFDFREGGDIWNGTKAVLDFYGKSAETAALRNVRGYIFDGVNLNGEKNNIPVDFYNPSLGVNNNLWMRYGIGGVGETHIIDGSTYRMKEVRCTYNFRINRFKYSEFAISVTGKNLVFFKKPAGVNPYANFMDDRLGYGLEFFNLPLTRSYGISLNVKF